VLDSKGNLVSVGSKVKVLSIHSTITGELQEHELKDVNSMLGCIFEVYEIDQHEHAWVEKWWNIDEENSYSHSLALSSYEIEVVNS
jgi:hypothetical protein